MPVPENNLQTPAKIKLGEKLFNDKRFSVDGEVSCATCHAAEKGFTQVSPISDWIYYLNFMTKTGLHKPEHSGFLGWLEFFISDLTQQRIERKIKKMGIEGIKSHLDFGRVIIEIQF